MKNKKYTFGGVTFELLLPGPISDSDNCEDFLADGDAVPDHSIRVIPEEVPNNTVGRCERTGNVIYRYMSDKSIQNATVPYLFCSSDAAYLFPEHDAFILHASYVVFEGKAILFTAPSGTGKSTQAEYWHKRRGAEIVNGDRVLVTRREGKFYANGIFASGTSGISRNVTAPIEAVVLLEQGETNEKADIPARILFLRILCECSYKMEDTAQYEKITELVSDMLNTVPTVCYRCLDNEGAVDELERILWNKR